MVAIWVLFLSFPGPLYLSPLELGFIFGAFRSGRTTKWRLKLRASRNGFLAVARGAVRLCLTGSL